MAWPLALGVALAVALAVVVRFGYGAELWLDEALSVNIARLPLGQIPEALRHDGAPPLYYFLLHGWMALVGDSNVAVRALSGVFAVASLPLMWLAGRRLGGSAVGWAAALLLAASPFAVHFADETRMYSLVVFLVLAGFLALSAVLERPRPVPVVGLALAGGLLALAHYWALYLIAATLGALVLRAWIGRAAARRHALVAVASIAAGGLLFLPWFPAFVFQIRHTGTPWADRAKLTSIFDVVVDFSGGGWGTARLLLLAMVLLAAVGLFGRGLEGSRLELDLRTRPAGRGVALVTALTLVLGLAAGYLGDSGFATRYASVVLAPFLLLVALGFGALAEPRLRHGLLALVVGLGLVGGYRETTAIRTQAGVNAAALNANALDGDVIAYCPDQLGPGTSRLVDDRFDQLSFPTGDRPQLVDWVDYAQRQARANPTRFAQMLDARAGDGHDVWLVWDPGYRTFENYCEIIERDLGDIRPMAEVVQRRLAGYGETAWLIRYSASCRLPLDRADAPSAAATAAGQPLPRDAVFTRPVATTCAAATAANAATQPQSTKPPSTQQEKATP
ncbi:MAG: glycosyltransferase family 39 protein [Acidimicrobiales bacterium]